MYFQKNKELLTELHLERVQQWISYFKVSDSIQEYKTASQGQENIVLLLKSQEGTRYVLKVYSISETHFTATYIERIMTREIAFVTFLRERGLPVPQFYETKHGELYRKERYKGCLLFVTLSQYIEGQTQHYTTGQVKAMATLQARLHMISKEFPAENFYREDDKDYSMLAYRMKQRKAITAKYFPHGLYKRLEDLYDYVHPILANFYAKHEKILIHCDVKFDNVLMNGARIQALIDFGDVRYSTNHEDIGSTIFYMCDYLHDRKLEFCSYLSFYFQAYEKESTSFTSKLDKKISLYYAIERFLVWNLYYLAEDQHDKKEILYQAEIAKKHLRLIAQLFSFLKQ